MYAYKFSDEFNLEENSKREELAEKLKNIDSKYSFKKSLEQTIPNEKSADGLEQFVDKAHIQVENSEKNSIYNEVMKEFEEEKLNDENQAQKEFEGQIFKLENERSLLEQQKNMALASFDISYAAKIAGEIEEINLDILKRRKDFLESKAKCEEEINNQNNSDNEELLNLVSKFGQEKVDDMKFEEKYNVVKNFLQEMPKQQAIAELEDEKYKSELGEYFDTLYAETFSREK